MSLPRAAAAVDGVLLLDKPKGMTSNAALQRVRALYGRPKAGHTGTLDPLATGLLPICLGEATKFSSALLGADKSYQATFQLGFRSSTGDADGHLEPATGPAFTDQQLQAALAELTGSIEQTPPMYSAVKVHGKPLYRYARGGSTVERRARTVHIRRLDLVERQPDGLRLTVTCSKGTYIRVLAEQLGAKLGCGAYVLALRRTAVGRISIEEAVPLPELESLDIADRRELLLPVDALLYTLPRLELSAELGTRVLRGLAVTGLAATEGPVRLYGPEGRFLGLGQADGSGTVAPKRLVADRPEIGLTL